MKRREFMTLVGGAAAAWPLAARAQERVRRIGVFIAYAEGDPETKSRLTAFRLGLAKRGWLEGRNVRIDYRLAGASVGQHQSLAKELTTPRPDVVLAHTTAIAVALKRESPDTPVVFVNVSKSDRGRSRRQPAAAGRQRHRRDPLRADHRRQVAWHA
jgi:putative tryptophan/tyrosine transport system substrate-binding protein